MLDTWAAGPAYEAYVGRWSREIAMGFLRWLDLPAGWRWLDVGCGTGALSAAILALAEPAAVTGLDPSEGFLEHARTHLPDPRASFHRADARSLPVGDASADAVVSGLALNFVPEPERVLAEFARVTVPGGAVAAYVWDYAGGMAMLRYFWDVAAQVDPAAAELDEGRRFPLCDPDELAALWRGAGLRAVAVAPIEVPTVFVDFDDFWRPFLGGQGPAPGYVGGLTPQRRDELRDRLRATLPVEADGSILLAARAWAVRGTA